MSAVDNITFEPHSDTYLQENPSNQTTTLPLVPNPLVTTQQPLPTTWYHPGKPATQKPPKHRSDSVKHSITSHPHKQNQGTTKQPPRSTREPTWQLPETIQKPSSSLVPFPTYHPPLGTMVRLGLLVFGLPLVFQRCGVKTKQTSDWSHPFDVPPLLLWLCRVKNDVMVVSPAVTLKISYK